MPTVTRQGDLFMVSWITGPQHVWLRVKFSATEVRPTLVMHPPIGNGAAAPIDEHRLLAEVEAAAREFGLHPERIEYIENDSPAYGLYADCARLLAAAAAR